MLSAIRNPIQQDEVTVTFYITEDGATVVATDVSDVFEELGIAKTSAELGLEVCRSLFYCLKRQHTEAHHIKETVKSLDAKKKEKKNYVT